MAKKTVTTTEELDTESANSGEDTLENDVIRALTEIEGADDIRWQIHRTSQPNPGFCPPELSTSELTMQRISECGPGRYKVRGIQSDGKYFKSATVTIAAGPPKKETDPADLIAALKSRDGAPQDNTALLLAMLQQNTSILTAALNRQSAPVPWGSIITTLPLVMTAAKDYLVKPDADEKSLEKVLKMLTVVEKLRGDGKESGSNWTDIVRDALQGLPAMVAGMSGRGPHPVSARVVPAASMSAGNPGIPSTHHELHSAGVETPEAVAAEPSDVITNWLKQRIDELIQRAASNRNPELHAEVFCDDLPALLPVPIVLDMLKADDWFSRLAEFDARVAPYEGWFTEFRDCVIATLQPDGEDDNGVTQ